MFFLFDGLKQLDNLEMVGRKIMAKSIRAAKQRAVPAAVEPPVSVPILVTSTHAFLELWQSKEYNISPSFYEAKSGYKMAAIAPALCDVLEELKSVTKWADKSMANLLSTSGAAECRLEGETSRLKKVQKILKKAWNCALFTCHPFPIDEPWAALVHTPTYFGQKKNTYHVGLSHMGCFECRMVLEGCMQIFGIKTEVCPGGCFFYALEACCLRVSNVAVSGPATLLSQGQQRCCCCLRVSNVAVSGTATLLSQ